MMEQSQNLRKEKIEMELDRNTYNAVLRVSKKMGKTPDEIVEDAIRDFLSWPKEKQDEFIESIAKEKQRDPPCSK